MRGPSNQFILRLVALDDGLFEFAGSFLGSDFGGGLLGGFHARGGAEADFFSVAFGIEGEEAGEDFVADVVGPAVAPGLFLFALPPASGLVVFVFLVVEEELAVGGDVGGNGGVDARLSALDSLRGKFRWI
jgi:hypothetical protein